MKSIVLFASGSGSNVENIANYFKAQPNVQVSCVLTNKADAYVLERCKKLKIPALYFNRSAFTTSNVVIDLLQSLNPDLIVLAGFLLKVPEAMVKAFPNKIINIHPALLPKYGGKGMYGNHVHQAVKDQKEKETGISIHYVNEHYDEGAIIFQQAVNVDPEDTVAAIAAKVHALEYEYFPAIIAKLLS